MIEPNCMIFESKKFFGSHHSWVAHRINYNAVTERHSFMYVRNSKNEKDKMIHFTSPPCACNSKWAFV